MAHRSRATTADWSCSAASSVPAYLVPVCVLCVGAPSAALRGTPDKASCGSARDLRAPASSLSADTRSAAAPPPAPAIVASMPSRPVVCTGSAESNDPTRPTRTHAADSARDAPSPSSLLLAAPQASDVFSEQVLERRVVQHRLRQQLLQPPGLILQRLQPASLGDAEPAVFCFPLVEGRARDPVAPADFLSLGPGLVLPQHADDLFFAEAASFHRPSPLSGDGLYLISAEFSGCRPDEMTSPWIVGQVQGDKAPTQILGRVVHAVRRIEAILFPSSKDRPEGRCLAVLPDRLKRGSSLEIVDETGLVKERLP